MSDYQTFRRIRHTLHTHGGFPPGLAWWDEQFERFYLSGVKRFVARVGRGGVKSTTIVDASLVEVVYRRWIVPPGEVHYFAWVSQNKSEAGQRQGQLEARLQALGIPYDRAGDTITLRDRPLGWRVFACQIGAVSGFRCIGFAADELAKWMYQDGSSNPGPEVVASLRAMTVTHKRAREFYISTPFGMDDLHYQLVEKGDTAEQVVACAPTWVANPTITEAETHELEPDLRVWSREYAAQPTATVTAAFDPADLSACFVRTPTGRAARGFVAIDASSLRGDSFTYVGGHITQTGEIAVLECDGWDEEKQRHTTIEDIVRHIAGRAKAWRAPTIYGDHHEQASLPALFSRHHVTLRIIPWSNASKDHAVQWLRRTMRERTLCLPNHPQLRRQLSNLQARALPSGLTAYKLNGQDYAAALVSLAHAAVEKALPGATPRSKTLLQALGELTPQELAARLNTFGARHGSPYSVDHRDLQLKEFVHGQWVPVRHRLR